MDTSTDGIAGSLPGELKFYPSVKALFVWSLVMAIPAGWILTTGWYVVAGVNILSSRVLLGFLVGGIGGAGFGLLMAFLLCRCFWLKLNAEGLHGHNAVGATRFMAWADIARVRPFSLLGLTYLRLYSNNSRRPVWIFLFLSQPVEFKRVVSSLAPPGSPIMSHV